MACTNELTEIVENNEVITNKDSNNINVSDKEENTGGGGFSIEIDDSWAGEFNYYINL
jgi:hypothetical protein